VDTGPGTTVLKAASRAPYISTTLDNCLSGGRFEYTCNGSGDTVVDVLRVEPDGVGALALA